MAKASDITFHYFQGRGIGEPIRLILTVGGVPFTDRRYTVEEFAADDALKARLPFGQTPALEVDGVVFAQTDSVARLAARIAGLYPKDPFDAAKSDMIVVAQAEVQGAIAKMSYDGVPGAPGTKLLPEAERTERIGAFFDSVLPGILARLEALVGERYLAGEALSWADLCIYNRLNQVLDRDPRFLDGQLPKLAALYDEVGALPAVRAWIRQHPVTTTRARARFANRRSTSLGGSREARSRCRRDPCRSPS